LSELANIVSAWETAIANREEIAMATVIRTEGASYRKLGAWMLVTRDGTRVGTISGGCLEAEVARRIWWLTENGAWIRRYSTDSDEDAKDGYGLGCGGAIHLLLERHCGRQRNQPHSKYVHDGGMPTPSRRISRNNPVTALDSFFLRHYDSWRAARP
jgi:xanthine/CO dehydrogenase XdhC/CoxF family maturation factor